VIIFRQQGLMGRKEFSWDMFTAGNIAAAFKKVFVRSTGRPHQEKKIGKTTGEE